MSGKWDSRERDMEEHNRRIRGREDNEDDFDYDLDDGPPNISDNTSNNNSTPNENNNNDSNGWAPRHYDPEPPDDDNKKKIYSVTEASRLHEGKDIKVIGVISGIQPLRKMIKGLSVQCLRCNTTYDRKYDKPELFESYVTIERIRKCPECRTGDYLGRYKWENCNAVIVELKDHNTFSEIDPLRIIVFGDDEPAFDDTINIDRHIGETVVVRGDIYSVDIGRRRGESKVVAYLYVTYRVRYLSKQELELTAEDVKAIKRFVNHVGLDNIVDKLAEIFATSIIGNNHVKKGLLLSAASTNIDKSAKKLHSILVGDPGLAKSELLKSSARLVPNSRYESVQFATGKSLTAIVTKEEGDALILRIGPIPQAKGAIAALNEIGRMSHEDQGLLLDTMQEQEFTTNKFGQNFHVDAPTAIIASANPVGGSWKSYEGDDSQIHLDKIPMIKPLIDRFDFIFVFRDSRGEEHLTEYANKKSEMEDKLVPDYTTYLAKHIMYAKQHCPKVKFSDEARTMLNQYYVSVRASYGSPRILKTIYTVAANIARLKLKREVDAADANETMKFYNVILQQLGKIVSLPSSPKDITYAECLKVLMDSLYPMACDEVVKTASARNQHVSKYVGKSFKLDHNKKLRAIVEMLKNHSRIKIVQMKPIALQYIHNGKNAALHDDNKIMVKADKQASDLSDPSDLHSDTFAKNLGGNDEGSDDSIARDLNVYGDDQVDGNSQKGPEITQKNISQVCVDKSYRAYRSDSNGNGNLLKCYYCEKAGKSFQTNSREEYDRHGSLRHLNKPMYPNLAAIKDNGLKPQGKEWEV
jgi:DNA replicative helicase MCM subunit Mcm2 (Cdc46/Mcm family)